MNPTVILGLGVSGLGSAIELMRRGSPFLAFEKEERPGGLARTDSAAGFTCDYGPHILLGLPPELGHIFNQIELAEHSGVSGIALDADLDSVIPAPFQLNLNLLPIRSRVSLLAGLLRDRLWPGEARNYAEYAAARCGRSVYNLFIRDYETKRLRVPLREIPAAWAARLERTSLSSILRGSREPRRSRLRESQFYYPRRGGIEALPRAMAGMLPAGAARYRSEAAEIRPGAKTIVLASGEAVPYGHLISTIPLPELISRIPEAPPAVRQAASSLLFTSIYVLSALLEGPVPSWTVLRFPQPRLGFYRLSFPCTYGVRPAGSRRIVVGEIGHHPVRHPLSAEEAKQQFHAGLELLGILRQPEQPVAEILRNIRYGHTPHNHRTAAALAIIFDYLDRHSITVCGKYGLWKDLLIPQSIVSGIEAARHVCPDRRVDPDLDRLPLSDRLIDRGAK